MVDRTAHHVEDISHASQYSAECLEKIEAQLGRIATALERQNELTAESLAMSGVTKDLMLGRVAHERIELISAKVDAEGGLQIAMRDGYPQQDIDHERVRAARAAQLLFFHESAYPWIQSVNLGDGDEPDGGFDA